MKLLSKFTTVVIFAVTLPCSAANHEVMALSEDIAKEYDLDQSFYAKTTMAEGILIATSNKVPDTTHLEAAYLFEKMMKELKEPIAQRIREAKVLCLLVAHNELTSDLPEFKSDKTGKELDFYNWRQRGFLTKVKGRYVVLFAEEDVMEYEGGMQIESILIHEFGHVIHGVGFDEALNKQWTKTFMTAEAKGLWNDARAAQRFRRVQGDQPVFLLDALSKAFPKQTPTFLKMLLDRGDILVNDKPTTSAVKVTEKDLVLIVFGGKKQGYAAKNRAEYFAEGIQSWYNTNRTMDHDHNHIHTREQLKKYDPALAQLCADVLGDHEWRFVSPRERIAQDHLKDYDPAKAPVVKDADHIRDAGLDYFDEYWEGYWQRLHDKYPSE
ncbi:MAG: hypothetical protein QNL33_01285 [Akkermansiaceae bacterium]|jgi:hypothetical protein